jgi:hypothetical protein
MINIPLVSDSAICVDEQAANLLADYRVASVHVVQDGETLTEADFNSLAIFALTRLKVLIRKRNLEEDGIVYRLRRRTRRKIQVFRILSDLLEARIRAVKAGNGLFLRPTPSASRRLERHLHLSEIF